MKIDELAREVHRWRSIELAAARLLGEWIPVAEPESLRSTMAAWARNFSWHAELWAERLPTVPGADWTTPSPNASNPNASTSSPLSSHIVAEITSSAAAAIQILLDEVWDQLIDELRIAGAGIDPRLDGPTHRTIGLVLGDLERDRDQAHSVVSTA